VEEFLDLLQRAGDEIERLCFHVDQRIETLKGEIERLQEELTEAREMFVTADEEARATIEKLQNKGGYFDGIPL
jgi:predicted  nucleic acid-binding Zn-ribbon protein